MIKFFRNIRRVMISNNRASKYVLYAIGEIILVVIGILIALQINNWNENKKNIKFENEILTQIRDNLQKDKKSLENIRSIYFQAIKSSELLIDPDTRKKYNDSVPYWLGDVIQFNRFQPITSSYEALKSEGLQLVRNSELRQELGFYYDDEINRAIKGMGDIEDAFNIQWLPILEIHVADFRFREYLFVENISKFFNETNAIRLLILNRDNVGAAVVHVNNAIQKIDEIHSLMPEDLRTPE